jgi:uncharacterized protein YecT (DUF1311 family)
MKTRLLFAFLFLLVVPAYAQTQMDLNDDAEKEYRKADKELNRVYLEIIKKNADDTAFIKNLKIAKQSWEQFRDAEMKMKYPDREPYYYGSIFSLCWYTYLTELTNTRIKTLRIWLEGEEPGSACGGTVPEKG